MQRRIAFGRRVQVEEQDPDFSAYDDYDNGTSAESQVYDVNDVDTAESLLEEFSIDGAKRAAGALLAGWQEETFRRRKFACLRVLGMYRIIAPAENDEEIRWPAIVLQVTRTPWRSDQRTRTGWLAMYQTADLAGLEVVELDKAPAAKWFAGKRSGAASVRNGEK